MAAAKKKSPEERIKERWDNYLSPNPDPNIPDPKDPNVYFEGQGPVEDVYMDHPSYMYSNSPEQPAQPAQPAQPESILDRIRRYKDEAVEFLTPGKFNQDLPANPIIESLLQRKAEEEQRGQFFDPDGRFIGNPAPGGSARNAYGPIVDPDDPDYFKEDFTRQPFSQSASLFEPLLGPIDSENLSFNENGMKRTQKYKNPQTGEETTVTTSTPRSVVGERTAHEPEPKVGRDWNLKDVAEHQKFLEYAKMAPEYEGTPPGPTDLSGVSPYELPTKPRTAAQAAVSSALEAAPFQPKSFQEIQEMIKGKEDTNLGAGASPEARSAYDEDLIAPWNLHYVGPAQGLDTRPLTDFINAMFPGTNLADRDPKKEWAEVMKSAALIEKHKKGSDKTAEKEFDNKKLAIDTYLEQQKIQERIYRERLKATAKKDDVAVRNAAFKNKMITDLSKHYGEVLKLNTDITKLKAGALTEDTKRKHIEYIEKLKFHNSKIDGVFNYILDVQKMLAGKNIDFNASEKAFINKIAMENLRYEHDVDLEKLKAKLGTGKSGSVPIGKTFRSIEDSVVGTFNNAVGQRGSNPTKLLFKSTKTSPAKAVSSATKYITPENAPGWQEVSKADVQDYIETLLRDYDAARPKIKQLLEKKGIDPKKFDFNQYLKNTVDKQLEKDPDYLKKRFPRVFK